MNTTNIQLQESVVNASLAKVDEIGLMLRASEMSFPSGSIRWKANSAATFTVRVVTASDETTQAVTLSQNGWSNISFANQDCMVFISPKSKISEFQLTDSVSGYVSIDWPTFIYSGVRKLTTYRSCIDTAILPLLTNITQWDSRYHEQVVDFEPFKHMTALTYLNLQEVTMDGSTDGIEALSSIEQLRLINVLNLYCRLSDFSQLAHLESLLCSGNSNVHGVLEDMLPLSGTLTTLSLNGSVNVSGNLKTLKNFHFLTECSLGMTGVSGRITDLSGMKTSGSLHLRASDYMINDIVSPAVRLNNNQYYTITFTNGMVSSVVEDIS